MDCDGDSARFASTVVRDSSGIRIVENVGYRWPGGRGWYLAPAPLLDIGVLEGDLDYQFFRITGALRLDDGRIVVANHGTSELRFFDEAGTFISSSAGKGGGPGESEELFWPMVLTGDSIASYDWRNQRISVFNWNGRFVRSFVLRFLPQVVGFPDYIAPFADGTLLITAMLAMESLETENGVERETELYVRCDREGLVVDTLGRFPGDERYAVESEEGTVSGGRAFGRASQTAVSGNGFYFGSSDSYEIGYYSVDGSLERLIRLARPNRKVTDDDIERYREEELRGTRDSRDRQLAEILLSDMPFPATMRAYGRFIVDAEGNLWVAEYRPSDDDQPAWNVFDPHGVLLGVVQTPRRFYITQIGSDFVLGRALDEIDVEHVQMYELKRRWR
jgi:hypothetical protein